MTVTEKSSRKLISGTGWANPLTHAFLLENQTQVKVFADAVELVLGVDYSVSNLNDEDGYNVTITNPTAWAPVWWVLSVEPPINQPSPLSLGGQFGAAYEAALDTTTRRLQRVWSATERVWKVPLHVPVGGTLDVLPEGHFWIADEYGNMVDGGPADAIGQANDKAIIAVEAAAVAVQARDDAINTVPTVFSATLDDLKDLDTTTKTASFLKQAGRAGQFFWRTGDFSTHVNADPLEGVFVKANGVSATLGAWERADKVTLEPRMFGASSSASAAVNTAAFLACRDMARFLGLAGFFVVAEEDPYQMTAGTNLSDNSDLYNGLSIKGKGRPTLKMIGSGEGLKIVNTVASNEYRWHVENFIIEGGPTITEAFVLGNINHSTFKAIETRECTHAGISTYNTVMNNWEQVTGGNGNYTAQTTTPAFAWLRANDYASTYLQCKGEGAVHNLYTAGFAASAVSVANDTITIAGHRFTTGEPIFLTTDNSLPVGTDATEAFYIIKVDADTIKLAISYDNAMAGTAVNMTTQGIGNHVVNLMHTGVGYFNSDWSTDYNGAYEGMCCGYNVLDNRCSHLGGYKTDFEGNTHHDIILTGDEHRFDTIQSVSATYFENILLKDGCTNPTFIGGFLRRVHNPTDSEAKFIGIAFSDHPSLGITGTGSRKVFGCVARNVAGDITSILDDRMGGIYAFKNSSSNIVTAYRFDSLAGVLLTLRADGVAYIPPAYNQTAAAASNLFVGTDGQLARATSALKYKTVKGPIPDDMVEKVMSIVGFLYTDKNGYVDNGSSEFEPGREFVGLAADHFHEAGLHQFVHYGMDGEVEGLMYERIIAVLMQEARSVRRRLDALEAAGVGVAP